MLHTIFITLLTDTHRLTLETLHFIMNIIHTIKYKGPTGTLVKNVFRNQDHEPG